MKSLWLSLFDHHDVSEDDIRSYESSAFDEVHLEATTLHDDRLFFWKCCGKTERMGFAHWCKPPTLAEPEAEGA